MNALNVYLILIADALEGNKTFLEMLRKIFMIAYVPMIMITLKIISLGRIVNVTSRNSIRTPGNFNPFYSDIDLTLVCENATQSWKLLKLYFSLKKIFLNLGEPEIYTKNELDLCQRYFSEISEDIWQKIFLIRKLKWENEKLKKEFRPLHRKKSLRALKKISSRLNINRNTICIDTLFNFNHTITAPAIAPEQYQHYLDISFSNTNTNTSHTYLFYRNMDQLYTLLAILPDRSDIGDLNSSLLQIKRYILLKEFLLSLTSLRISRYKNHSIDDLKKMTWLLFLLSELESLIAKEEFEILNSSTINLKNNISQLY